MNKVSLFIALACIYSGNASAESIHDLYGNAQAKAYSALAELEKTLAASRKLTSDWKMEGAIAAPGSNDKSLSVAVTDTVTVSKDISAATTKPEVKPVTTPSVVAGITDMDMEDPDLAANQIIQDALASGQPVEIAMLSQKPTPLAIPKEPGQDANGHKGRKKSRTMGIRDAELASIAQELINAGIIDMPPSRQPVQVTMATKQPVLGGTPSGLPETPLLPLAVASTKADSNPNYYDYRYASTADAPPNIMPDVGSQPDSGSKPSITSAPDGNQATSAAQGNPQPLKMHLNVRSGVNQIIQVAVDHTNRIITPFAKPKLISTVSEQEAVISIHDRVIYIAPKVMSPISFYIRNADNEENVISVTLAPKRVPPIEASISLIGYETDSFGSQANLEEAKAWERSTAYEDNIQDLLSTIADERVPPGYRMRAFMPGKDHTPNCYQTGIAYNFHQGQVITGHSYSVLVGVASNQSKSTLQIKENACSHQHLVAASAFPYVALESGAKTEFYVVLRNPTRQPRNQRPSLLSQNR